MVFTPTEGPLGSSPSFEDAASDAWEEMYHHPCTFGPNVFEAKMMNIIKNPNINTSWLFRADIIYDDEAGAPAHGDGKTEPRVRIMRDVPCQRTLVRTLVPRNAQRDAPLDQTCTFHRSQDEDGLVRTLIIYVPHVDSPEEMPFYHPEVQALAHLHRWDPSSGSGTVSIHFLPFPGHSLQGKNQRTALRLLEIICKHGQGADYVKRVAHDVVVSQVRSQERYALLKKKYAKLLLDSWTEQTDPQKHVFEDLCIAAFLLELWTDMYQGVAFPGFVDIGCGNGLLVWILNKEGRSGWGFDARARASWKNYEIDQQPSPSGKSLEQRLLLPYMIPEEGQDGHSEALSSSAIHDGRFPEGTFIISNHADELTPWTPILASASNCPFIMIPCCSHDLSGAKYRAPPPKDKSKGESTYASLVVWVAQIAEDCGYKVETEMLRIPSTRNTGLIGRTRLATDSKVDPAAIIAKYGGTGTYRATVAKLLKSKPRGH